MSRNVLAIILLITAGTGAAQAQNSFTRGHVFVAVREPEACEFGGFEWIVEIDPETGASWVFADSNDGLCGVSGLRFTPDGTKLLAVNFGTFASGPPDGGWVQAFSPDGTSEIILDASDGLQSPSGANALAFDTNGDLFVLTGDNFSILRYVGLAGPPTIFADSADGVGFRGALEFAPSGDLYHASVGGAVWRISTDGQGFLFDDAEGPLSIAADRKGNIFYEDRFGSIIRFDCEDASTRHSIATGYNAFAAAFAFSPDDQTIYLGSFGSVFAIEADSGLEIDEIDLGHISPFDLYSRGIAVFAPRIPGDVDGDGDVDLRDHFEMVNCQGWTRMPNDCACVPADLNKDDVLDVLDWRQFVGTLTGPLSAKNAALSHARSK